MSTAAVRLALVAAINGDATLQGLMGRATDLVRAWVDSGAAPLPILAYQLLPFEQAGAIGDTWRGSVQLSAFADDATSDDPIATVEAMMDRCIDLLNYPAFAAQGLDAASLVMRRMDVVEDREDTRGTVRADLEIDLTLFYP